MKNRNGSAVIITVLIVTILVALVVEFAYEVYIDTSSLSNWTNAQKASLIAKSGQTLSSGYITELKKIHNTQSEVELSVERDFGADTQLTVKIEDENAKLNINNIIHANGKPNNDAILSLKKLFEYLNINSKLVDVIADWIDPDSEPREGLSDSEDNVKNAYLSTLDELKLIKGFDGDIFDRISPYLTVYEDRSRVNRFDTLININTAKLPVLASLLASIDDNMNESHAKQIIDYREITPFEKKGQIVDIVGRTIGIRLQSKITVTNINSRVTARATVNDITRIIESVVDRSMNIHSWREQ